MPDAPPPAAVFSSWQSLIALAVSTGLFTAIFNQGIGWVRETLHERRKDRRAGRSLALELTSVLTQYAQECYSRYSYNVYDHEMGDPGRHTSMPELAPFPEGGWDVLPPRLAAAVHDFRREVEEAGRSVAATWEVQSNPVDAADTASKQYIVLGYTAVRLATQLRRRYRFGRYHAASTSDFESRLRARYSEVHQAALSRWWNSLPVYRVRRTISHLKWRITRGKRDR